MGKMTEKEFVLAAIPRLRDLSRSKGIHTVYSGFNQAFRTHFGTDPRVTTDAMAQAGELIVRPARGGVMLYLSDDAPDFVDKGAEALEKILADSSETET